MKKRNKQKKFDQNSRNETYVGTVREVKKSFCLLSAAYLVLGMVLLIWPDLSQRTLCYVFGVGLIIFGITHVILYFTKDKFESVLQMDMVAGIVGIATGAYILIKMEYMMDIIPFVLGIAALLGAAVKVQNAFDLKRLREERWYVMLAVALILLILGCLLVANPFDETKNIVEWIIGASLIIDGIGNLAGIFWVAHSFKRLNKVASGKETYDIAETVEEEGSIMVPDEDDFK